MAHQIIERYHLAHSNEGSDVIPSREILEGEDAGLDGRIDAYCTHWREIEPQLRQDLVMMIGFVYLMTRKSPDDLLHQWSLRAMSRHRLTPDHYTEKNPLWKPINLPHSDIVQ
jgi:hypothetical protein